MYHYMLYINDVCLLGANELAVQKAKTEITRLIKEELIRLVSIFCLLKSINTVYPADITVIVSDFVCHYILRAKKK